MKDDERCGRSKEVNTPDLIGQGVRVRVTNIADGDLYSPNPSARQQNVKEVQFLSGVQLA